MHLATVMPAASKPKLPMARPIRSERELERATQLAFQLSEAGERRKLSRDEADYLEVLLTLIERCEAARWPLRESAEPAERLRALVRDAGMTASDLGRLLGNRALGSKLLTGERELSKTHIRRLAEHFQIDAGFFF